MAELEDIIAILSAPIRWPELLHVPEDDQLDFKSTPPLPPRTAQSRANDRAALELAKDVSALANHKGGLLVYGARTEKNTSFQRDEVVEVTPFVPEESLRERVQSVVDSRLHPHVTYAVRVWPQDDGKALVTIRVERINEYDWPVIVRGAAEDEENITGNYIGVWIRDDDRCHHLSPESLQELLRLGQQWKRSGASTPVPTVEAPPEIPLASLGFAREAAAERLEEELTHLQNTEGAVLAVQAWPVVPAALEIHNRAPGTIARVIESPPSLRTAGFNLDFWGSIEAIAGGGIRKIDPEGMSLSVTPDGLTTLVVGQEYLGWGMPEARINTFALLEFVLELARFFRSVVLRGTAGPANYKIEIRRLVDGNTRFMPDRMGHFGVRAHPLSEGRETVSVQEQSGHTPEQVTAALLVKLYAEFGMGRQTIPFLTLDADGEISINTTALVDQR